MIYFVEIDDNDGLVTTAAHEDKYHALLAAVMVRNATITSANFKHRQYGATETFIPPDNYEDMLVYVLDMGFNMEWQVFEPCIPR